MSNHQLQFASKTDATGTNLGSPVCTLRDQRFSPFTRLGHHVLCTCWELLNYTLFEARRGPWIQHYPFLLGAQTSRYGLPTVFESMMWLLFLVGGGEVCSKGGKEEEESSATVFGTVVIISVSAVPDRTFCGRHGLSLLCPVWQLLATCDC